MNRSIGDWRRIVHVIRFVCILFACFSSAVPAAASDSDTYGSLVERGISEFNMGNWAEARAWFLKAHKIRPNARTLRGLGMTEFELRHYVKSARLLESSLVDQRNPLNDDQQKQVRELLERARSYIGSFRIELVPQNAKLVVDGISIQLEADDLLRLDTGDHKIKVSANGYRDKTRSLDVRGGEKKSISFVLEPIGLVSKPYTATESQRPKKSFGEVDEDDGSLWGEWWFWTLVAVAAGGVAAAVVITTSGERVQGALPGDDGLVISALREP